MSYVIDAWVGDGGALRVRVRNGERGSVCLDWSGYGATRVGADAGHAQAELKSLFQKLVLVSCRQKTTDEPSA